MEFTLPDYIPYLLGVLGLLLIWQLHQIQVTAGRIQATNFWERSGIRFFIHVTPLDDQTCQRCRETHGLVMLPTATSKKKFSPLRGRCTNPLGCRCQMIGLYGGWAQAQRLLDQLKLKSKSKRIKLNADKLKVLLKGDWRNGQQATMDHCSMHMLEAILAEESDFGTALANYRLILDQASSPRDQQLMIPAYLRLLDLYERVHQPQECLALIAEMEKGFKNSPNKLVKLSPAQSERVALLKTRLATSRRRAS